MDVDFGYEFFLTVPLNASAMSAVLVDVDEVCSVHLSEFYAILQGRLINTQYHPLC